MPSNSKKTVQPIKNKNMHKIVLSVPDKNDTIVKRRMNIFSPAHMKQLANIPISMKSDIIKKYNQDIKKLDKIVDRQKIEKRLRSFSAKNKKMIKKDGIDISTYVDRRKRFLTKTNVLVILSTTIDNKVYYNEVNVKLNFSYDCCPDDAQVLADVKDSLSRKPYYTFRKIVNIHTIDMQKRIIPADESKKAKKGAGKKNFNFIGKVKLGGCKLNYHFSKDYDSKREDNGMCVIDYLRYELQGHPNISQKLLSKQCLLKAFELDNLTDGVTLIQIINFVNQSRYISMFAFSPSGKLIKKIRATGDKDKSTTLVFMINNNHIYPIINVDYKQSVMKKEIIQLSDYKFDINYENCKYIEDIDNLFESDSKVKLIPEENDFTDVMHRVENMTTMITTNMKWDNGRLIAFENDGTVYEKTLYHNDRMELLKSLFKKYKKNNELFEFKNQTYAQIAKNLYEYHFGSLSALKSRLTEDQFNIFDTYKITAYFKVIGDNYEKTKGRYGVAWDINKSYADVLLTNTHDYNIFTEFDDVQVYRNEDIVNGEYYTSKRFEMSEGSDIWIENGFYPHNFIIYCLENKYISKIDITYCIKASYKLPARTMQKFINLIKNDSLQISDFKRLINFFIGTLGQKWTKKDTAINTNDLDTALYTMTEQELEGFDVELDWHEQESTGEILYQVRSRKSTMNLNTSLPIHRSIICGGIMNLDKLYKKIAAPNMLVVGYCTDSIKVLYLETLPEELYQKVLDNEVLDDDDESNNIANLEIGGFKSENYRVTGRTLDADACNPEFTMKIYEINNYNREDIPRLMEENKPFLLTGAPGTGKSYTLGHSMYKEGDIVLSFTNKAVVNCRAYGMNAKTLDIIFYSKEGSGDNIYSFINRIKKYKTIYVDEYSMTSPKHMSILYSIWKISKKKIIFIGDVNQCLSVSDKQYDYTRCNAFLEMIGGNIITLDYVADKCRQDSKLIKCIIYLLENGKLHPMLKKKEYNINANIHITKFNSADDTINNINSAIIDEILKVKSKNRKIKYINNNPYFTDMRLVCNVTNLEETLYRSELYQIVKFEKEDICMISETGNKIKVKFDNIGWFSPAYGMTVYRYQGSSIDEPFNIMNIEQMSLREIYTAISRARNYDDLNLDYIDKIFTNSLIETVSTSIKSSPKKHEKKKDKTEIIKKKDFNIIAPVKIIIEKSEYITDTVRQELRVTCDGIRKKFKYKKCGLEAAILKVEQLLKDNLSK